MTFLFGLQKTRDSLKEAFESLFEKYGREFDDDDEIDILSLEVVKKSSKKNSAVQKPRKFGFLYRKEGEFIEEEGDESNDDDDEDSSKTSDDDQNDPTDLEKIFNERSNALVSVSNQNIEESSSNGNRFEKKTRKANRKTTQLAFDFAILRMLEWEKSIYLRKTVQLVCKYHPDGIERDCFDCSLINIIP